MDDQKQLRKYNNAIITCGKGIIAFGFWSVIKTSAIMLLSIPEYHAAYDGEVPLGVINLILLLFTFGGGGIVLGFHMFLGRSAIEAARKNKKKYLYIVVASIYAVILTINCVTWFYTDQTDKTENDVRLEQAQDLIEYGVDDMELDDIGIEGALAGIEVGDEEETTADEEETTTDEEETTADESETTADDEETTTDDEETTTDDEETTTDDEETTTDEEPAADQGSNTGTQLEINEEDVASMMNRTHSDSLYSYVLSFVGDIVLLTILVELIVNSVKRLKLI